MGLHVLSVFQGLGGDAFCFLVEFRIQTNGPKSPRPETTSVKPAGRGWLCVAANGIRLVKVIVVVACYLQEEVEEVLKLQYYISYASILVY